MEETKRLYPIKFCTIQDEYEWGREEFKLADLGYKDSLVREGWLAGNSIGELMDTYIDRITGDNTYEYYGRQFPNMRQAPHDKGRFTTSSAPWGRNRLATVRFSWKREAVVRNTVREGRTDIGGIQRPLRCFRVFHGMRV